jgi:hypothetical protein
MERNAGTLLSMNYPSLESGQKRIDGKRKGKDNKTASILARAQNVERKENRRNNSEENLGIESRKPSGMKERKKESMKN